MGLFRNLGLTVETNKNVIVKGVFYLNSSKSNFKKCNVWAIKNNKIHRCKQTVIEFKIVW